ncbi:hypothetical protein AMECASPLE_011016 [Ameca splendens]|uniref:Uncharacterized protein n=1 Tax=Ameca splendens TaxID=208324 RepID=A0ABV0ZLQ3_9TELE
MSSYSSLLRSFFVLITFLLLHSRTIPQQHNKGFLDSTHPKKMSSTSWEAHLAAGEDFGFGSKDGQGFPDMQPEFFLDDGALATQVWPRTMLDYMRQQLKFRGRTKKEDI